METLFTAGKKRRVRRIGSSRVLPSGRVQVRVRGVDPDGRRFELCRTCSPETRGEVLARLRVEAAEIKDGLRRKNPRLTLEQYKERFAKAHPWNGERESTWKMLRPLWALPLSQVTDSEVSKWATGATYRGTGRPPRGRGQGSRAYVLHCYELLRRLLRQAKADGFLSTVPCDARPPGVPSARAARKNRRPLTDDERRALLDTARADPDPSVYARLSVMAATGLRPEELRRALLANLWPAKDVCKSAPPGSYVLNCPDALKHGLPHLSPIPAAVARDLLRYVDSLPPEATATGFLFPIFRAGRWSQRAYFISRKRWRDLFRAAGLPADLVLYQLRHTRLTQWSNDTAIGARRAADLVGHADMRTTESYAARARGLVPEAFGWDLDPDPDPDPKKPPPAPSRRKKAVGEKNQETNPRRSRAPAYPPKPSDPRLSALASRVLAEGRDRVAWEVIDKLGDLVAVSFASELAEEASDRPVLVDLARRVRELVGGRLPNVRPDNPARAVAMEN